MVRIPNSVLRFLRPMNYYRFFLWKVKIIQIYFYSRSLNRELTVSGQRGLFLDCGSNIGQGFEFFRQYYPNDLFDYILFEPNPYCFDVLSRKYGALSEDGVQLRNVAVGVDDGEVDFYGLEIEKGGIYSVGGTVLQEHNSKVYKTPSTASLRVSSMNFSKLLSDILQKNEYAAVILKLDIEGGEYPILDSLISNDLIFKLESIYVEFHSKSMSSEFSSDYRNREKAFLNHTKKIGTRVIKWI